MKLKTIKIQGFKSFADVTMVDFDPHITCVVGPNGCGKSNVVDAIRWVMGEQSAKHLRGKNMEDVIFVGSESRPASALASVEITFAKDGTSAFPVQYENCEEISVGRHLFRSGESEYFINKQLVRLKDVTDFFLGTGVGTKAYAIIEQGRVEQLLTAKPEERRYIIEEAAGISKFKSRKEAALRRIEATNQNLSRLQDIILELERQVGSLDRQAKKAKRFRVISDELKVLDLQLASLAYERLDREQNECLVKMKEYDAQTTATQNEIAQDETWVEERRLTLAEVESALNELQQKVYEWENHLRLAEAKLQGRKDEDERIGLDCEQFDRQVEELNENLAGNQNGLSQINEKLCLAELECESFDQSVAEQQQYLEALEESSQQLFLILEQSRNDYHQSSQQLVELATRREGLEHRTQELRLKQENDQNDLDELSGRYKKLEALLHDSQSGLSSVKQLKLSLGEKTQELFQSLSDEELQIQTEQSQLDDTKQDLLQKKSRLQSLRELEKNFEGYHAGPRQILKRKQTGEMSSVMGSVAEFIDVANQFESAVSAVLGEVMQSVVVTTQHESITCADYLKSESLGRSSFVALSLAQAEQVSSSVEPVAAYAGAGGNLCYVEYLENDALSTTGNEGRSVCAGAPLTLCVDGVTNSSPQRGIPLAGRGVNSDLATLPAGVRGFLNEFVRMKDGYEPLARFLFGDVLLVDSLQAAFETWIKTKKSVVTLDGEFISQKGILTGGTLEDTSKSLLEKKREIKLLEEDVGRLVEQVVQQESVCQQLRVRIGELKAELENVKSFSHQEDLNIANQEKDIVYFAREMESLNARRGKLSEQILATISSIDDLNRQIDVLHADETGQKTIQEVAGTVLEQRRAEEDICRRDLAQKQEQLTREKIQLARSREQKAYLLQESERLIAEDVRLHRDIIRMTEKKVHLLRRREFIGQRAAFLEKLIQKMLGLKDKLDGQSRDTKNEFESINVSLRDREQHLKIRQREYHQIKDKLSETTVHLTEFRSELSRHVEQTLERYQLVLSEIYGQHLSPAETFNAEEARERASELRQRLAGIGAVNLGAIEELDQLQERFIFLSTQKQDLEASLQALERAIQKINRTTKVRFQETFDLVNDKFTKIFPRLFKGGHAYLQLTDPENILETGVDIIAQPPGKKLQSVSLLSGGEKALTAISLLFAIFLIKPSPFCLLDEVDAPLDDVNVDRYNEIVKELSQNTQFIVITHNKRTMQFTNCLFGVTMQEDGVSKVVSVAMDG